MEISDIASSTSAATTTSGSSSEELTNQFLTLLVAQLKNQDPTSPIENEQFVTQLAQLQSLEQQQKLTDSNQSLLLQSSLATGSSMIGKEVTGNITVAGQLVEATGTVQSLKLENNTVLFRVVTESGEVVSMSPDHLKTVSGIDI
jgi:flagellar basal-body rod modification protein FlgD